MLVWAPTRPIAQWARGAIANGPATFYPIVVGPDDIPRVTSPDQARADLSLAALSAIAHGGDRRGRPVLAAFVDAVVGLSAAAAAAAPPTRRSSTTGPMRSVSRRASEVGVPHAAAAAASTTSPVDDEDSDDAPTSRSRF